MGRAWNSIQFKDQINSAERFEEIIFDLEEEIKGLLCAERLTFYKSATPTGPRSCLGMGPTWKKRLGLPLSPHIDRRICGHE